MYRAEAGCAKDVKRFTAGGVRLVGIAVEGVSKFWGEAAAVRDLTFGVPAGELVALLGPSGCGKSTTLRLIAGLDTPDAGTIVIAGRDVTRAPPAKRGIAMVFQSYALFPHLTVGENIQFGLKVRRVPASERVARLKRAADMLGLSALLDRKPSQLSGGQQQRVALARAVVAEAPVCLMDEPLSNLDAQLRGEMRREIRALQQRLGMTMVYVTHDQSEAMTMADRVILMRGGEIEQNGTPVELYERPATAFAARFIGTPPMNVLSAPEIQAPALVHFPNGHAPDDLLVGIRPEAMRVDAEGVPARVVAVEYLGAETLIEARLATSSVVVRANGRIDAGIGDTLHLAWAPDDAHWFDAASGRRLDVT